MTKSLSNIQSNREISPTFSGLLRKSELYGLNTDVASYPRPRSMTYMLPWLGFATISIVDNGTQPTGTGHRAIRSRPPPGLAPPPPAPIVIGCHFARSVGGLLLWRRHVSVIALIELALKDEGVYFTLRGTFVAWNWAGLGPTVCWNGVLRGHFWWHYISKSRCEFWSHQI